jgi:uncharacterized protein (TIGR02300 family)
VGELGTRYKCFKCETKFYDLGRPQPICPACGEDQNNREPRLILKHRKKRSSLKMEPDIHLLSGDHDVLMGQEEHEDHEDHEHEEHDHEEHEAIVDMDEEKEAQSDRDEDYPQDGAGRDREEDGEGYRPESE